MGIFRDLGKGLSRLVIAHDRIKHLPPGNFYTYALSLKKRIKMHHATCCFGTRTKIVTEPKYLHQGCTSLMPLVSFWRV